MPQIPERHVVELHAIASGQVQGVGFRATARYHAIQLKLTGTVCNLSDGSVEIYAQGPRYLLDQFVLRLKQDAGLGRLDNLSTKYSEPTQNFDHFSIVYGRA